MEFPFGAMLCCNIVFLMWDILDVHAGRI